MSQRYGAHPGLELVVSGGFREILNVWSSDASRESLQQLPRVRPQDTRIVLHARDAAVRGYYQVSLLCHDTDVLRPSFRRTDKISVKKFGCSPVHFEQRDTVQSKEKRKSPLAFHTITGCDTTGPFAGIGKQSALKILDSLSKLVEHQGEHCPPEESVLADAEAFVCQLYNHGTDGVDINEERAAAFRKVKKNFDSLPPTKDALHLQIRRANLQCMIWKKVKEARPSLSRPEENGWFYKEGVLKPKPTNQEEVSAPCL